jgi:multidrug efflux pump subunit AcrA (membrane-fusion protein)
VTAPFDGIVTARTVSVGDYVGAGSPTVLATIVQLDPVYVNFTISERDVLRIRQMRRTDDAEDLEKVPAEFDCRPRRAARTKERSTTPADGGPRP